MKNIKGWMLPDWDKHYEPMLKLINNNYEYQYSLPTFHHTF